MAHRLVRDWPLALVVEIDALRGSLGAWTDRPESKTIARELAIALVQRQLEIGHDVVVPQLLVLPEFADRLRAVAGSAGASFTEVVLLTSADVVRERFLTRRAAFAASPVPVVHPEHDVADGDLDEAIRFAIVALQDPRPGRVVIDAAGSVDDVGERAAIALATARQGAPS